MNEINFGAVVAKVFATLIVKPLTLPVSIYKSVLAQLSGADAEDSEERNLSKDIPLCLWVLNYWNAIVAISWPLGLIVTLIAASNKWTGGFWVFLVGAIITYFLPLCFGMAREMWLIFLKRLLYLKMISKK